MDILLEKTNTFKVDSSETFYSSAYKKIKSEVSIKTRKSKIDNRFSNLGYKYRYVVKVSNAQDYNHSYEIIADRYLIEIIMSNSYKKITIDNSNIYAKNNSKTLNIITQKESLEKLKSIKNLEYDWDGYEAESMNPEIYNNASKLIEKIIIPPRVFPTANGTIQFEYHKKNNDDEYLEFEIFNNKIEVLFMRSDNDYMEYTYSINDIDKINNLIKEFYGID